MVYADFRFLPEVPIDSCQDSRVVVDKRPEIVCRKSADWVPAVAADSIDDNIETVGQAMKKLSQNSDNEPS